MAVLIGHASIDENGKASGGAAGDQTKKEVCMRNWYSKPWIAVIRPNDSTAAEKIVVAMEQACANHGAGYRERPELPFGRLHERNGERSDRKRHVHDH